MQRQIFPELLCQMAQRPEGRTDSSHARVQRHEVARCVHFFGKVLTSLLKVLLLKYSLPQLKIGVREGMKTERRRALVDWVAILAVAVPALVCAPPLGGQSAQRGRTANPHGNLKIVCENCHSTSAWKPIRAVPEFDHDTQTRYPLRGMHQGVSCRACHASLDFKNAATECAACHADIHRRQFGARCQECHTVRGWKTTITAMRQHNNRFPLIGAHATATCDGCHPGAATGIYNGLSTECIACHLKDYQQASAPDHKASGFSVNCSNCHSMDSWANAKFDHNQLTAFPLAGAHARLECAACHIGGRFKGTPATCFECHAANFAQAKDPDHAAAGFSHECTVCHNLTNWAGAAFDHTARTRFALAGAHAKVSCTQCHVNGRFAGTPKDCAGCHLADFEKTTNPNHRTGKFALTCEGCHTTSIWQGAKFDHSLSRFQLTGAHQISGVRIMPRWRALYGHFHALLQLPPARLPGIQESRPRCRRLPAGLRPLPHDGSVAGREIRPRGEDALCADRCAR